MSAIPKQENKFFLTVAIVLFILGVGSIIFGILTNNVGYPLFGVTLIYESLQVYQGKVPKSRSD